MEVTVVSDPDSLLRYIPAWEDLAAAALEPNPFFEHWFLLPALRSFRQGRDLRVALVFRSDPSGSPHNPVLCGVFPLERQRRFNSLPITAWSIWKHPYCFLTTPLVRAADAPECLAAFFEWLLSAESGASAVEWRYMPGDGPFHRLFVDELHRRDVVPFVWEWYTRAVLKNTNNADRYLASALSGKHRKALRRRAELMGEAGPVEFTMEPAGDEPDAAINSFLRLEASGWKGQEGSALLCKDTTRQFFLTAAREGFRRNRLMLPAVLVNGNVVAQNCYWKAGRAVFHFKTAFNEEYSRFSPGFHLECEMVKYVHTLPDVDWLDSCTSPDNEMFNRLYIERRTIQSLVIPLSTGFGRFVVSTMPFLRTLKKSARAVDVSVSRNGSSHE